MDFFTIAELEAALAAAKEMKLHPAMRIEVSKGFMSISLSAESGATTAFVSLLETDAITNKARKLYEAENWK